MYLLYFSICLFGILIGNFTTTLLYRLPRNIMPYGFNAEGSRLPFCSSCNHLLRFYEYLPILSWISTMGRCNYCNEKISNSYLYLEISSGFFAILCAYLYLPNVDIFLLKFCQCITVNLIIAINVNSANKVVPKSLIVALIIEGAIFRTLQDHEIISWLSIFCIASIIAMALIKSNFNDRLKEEFIHILLPASIWLTEGKLLIIAVIMGCIYLCTKRSNMYFNFYNISIASLLILAL